MATKTVTKLTVEAMSTEALTTSEIEGEILDRASVQSSIQRQLGLAADNRGAAPAERGVSEMMVNLYKTFAAPGSDDTLFQWHRMLMSGRQDLKDIGRYRTSIEPMQVLSGAMDSPKIHFEAPPSAKVPVEMKQFITWFNRTAPGGSEPLPALTRAGAAHLYFESIHPFEDGNGRIGRALAEKSLAQSLGQPFLIALAATILARRARYYAALEAANKSNEITEWLAWFAAYPTVLRPKLHVRRFRAPTPGWTEGVNLQPYHAYWGGEVAANRLLHHLVPQTAIIFAKETPRQLIADYKLRADVHGDVEILDAFWKDHVPPIGDVAPPILAYADLTATTDGRNLEAAKMIYDQYIEPAFRNPA